MKAVYTVIGVLPAYGAYNAGDDWLVGGMAGALVAGILLGGISVVRFAARKLRHE